VSHRPKYTVNPPDLEDQSNFNLRPHEGVAVGLHGTRPSSPAPVIMAGEFAIATAARYEFKKHKSSNRKDSALGIALPSH
jgi:hypothetical protein